MKLTLPAVLLCGIAFVGCQQDKKRPDTSPMPAAGGVLDISPAPVAQYTPPPAPQPIVYDTPQQREQPLIEDAYADASDDYVPAAAPTPRPVARKTTPAPSGKKYTIKKGESLWSIAQTRYGDGTKWTRIAAANPKINPDKVQAGQTIILP